MVFIKQNLIKINENKNQYKTDDISKKENINIKKSNLNKIDSNKIIVKTTIYIKSKKNFPI